MRTPLFLLPLLLPLFFLQVTVYGQENCSNAIDDDGDGLIDLNDPQCNCSSNPPQNPASLIQNPSFEQIQFCPSGFSQFGQTAFPWIIATNGTSDLLNTCDFTFQDEIPSQSFVPFSDGNGGAGMFIQQNYKEFIAQGLASPLQAGTAYTLKLDASFTALRGFGSAPCPNSVYPPVMDPVELTLYGSPSFVILPQMATQPNYNVPPPFVPIGTVTYYPTPNDGWHELTMTFVPTFTVAQVVFGAPVDMSYDYIWHECGPYLVVDNFRLNTSASFGELFVTQTGDLCTGNVQLHAYPSVLSPS